MLKNMLALLSTVAIATGRPVTPVPLASATSEADVIVVGLLNQAFQSGPVFTGKIEVLRVLKGAISPGSTVAVTFKSIEEVTIVRAVPPATGMWFLKGVDSYQIIPKILEADDVSDLVYPVAPSMPPSAFASGMNDTVLDRIVLELAATVAGAGTSPNPSILFTLANAPASRSVYTRLMSSASTEVLAATCAALLYQQDTKALGLCEMRIGQLANTRAAMFLADSIEELRMADPASVAALGRLATSSSGSPFGRSAARALAAIHTAVSLPFLIEMLDSDDFQVRTSAVNGLSAFVMNLPVRTRESFTSMAWLRAVAPPTELNKETQENLELGQITQGREAQLIDFWKDWWKQNSARLLAR
jgi:hypothetical protein